MVSDITLSVTITNGMVIHKNVSAGNSDNFPFSIKNTSTSNKIYKMTKFYDLRNVIASGDSSYATFQFCGFHFAPLTNTSVCSVTLTPNQTDPTPVAEFLEASVPGKSDIRWRIYEVNNPTVDFTEFTLRYNDASAGITSFSESISSVSEIFPCPANSKASIAIHSKEPAGMINLVIYNVFGVIVSKQICELAKGTNNVSIATNDLGSGIYFVSLISNNSKVQRKLVIEK